VHACGLPALALGVDPGDPDIMEKKPRDSNESIFSRDVKLYLTAVPILMSILLLASFVYHQPWLNAEAEVKARTLLFNGMVFMELANALNARSLKHTIFELVYFATSSCGSLCFHQQPSSSSYSTFLNYTPCLT